MLHGSDAILAGSIKSFSISSSGFLGFRTFIILKKSVIPVTYVCERRLYGYPGLLLSHAEIPLSGHRLIFRLKQKTARASRTVRHSCLKPSSLIALLPCNLFLSIAQFYYNATKKLLLLKHCPVPIQKEFLSCSFLTTFLPKSIISLQPFKVKIASFESFL